MKRILFMAVVMCLWPAMVRADEPGVTLPAPRPAVARLAGEFILIEESRVVTEYVPEQRTVEKDGMKMVTTVLVPVQKKVQVIAKVDRKATKAFDLDGKAIDSEKLAGLLKEKAAVVLSEVPKLNATQRGALKVGTIVLVLPPKPSAPDSPKKNN